MKCVRCGWERLPKKKCENPDCRPHSTKAKQRVSDAMARNRGGPRQIVGKDIKSKYNISQDNNGT